ncbi:MULTISPECIES: flagellar export chaperone FliS [Tissierellales]|jgi:flagellar protein FliS|uniref:Flagellar secretion chaperone FliS n=1 Tax=Acidilutibacter cellobiosedens TaxID=2507161 RepID=A0A410Q9S8_9FIRM|nr:MULTISPECIES: flagellar export chaperone FliS [Tissierellales]MBE6083129.1 flagellar export chaperone FliS [Tissierellaceae bacterium]QAT60753.1 flagellar export chaperone FliS [Acidilutibacter cellobiosedens]SCL87501.1 Flagellar protein FliS [Sporanaerobacter sp. PP17-6a]
MSLSVLNQYKQNSILTAAPEELTLMLFDGAIKFVNLGKIHIENGEIEKANSAILRAQDIIVELDSSLDMKYEISKNLDEIYKFILNRLIAANLKKDIAPLDESLELLNEIRDTWKELTREIKKMRYGNKQVKI